MKHIVLRRKQALYRELGAADGTLLTLIALSLLPFAGHGIAGRANAWRGILAVAAEKLKPNEALFRLVEETGVILLPGRGFGTTHCPAASRWPT